MANAEGAGDRIAQALRGAGLRPVDLARRLKVSQPTVHGWVNQLHGITWANARRVAAALNVSPGWIMFGSDEEAERVAQTGEELAFLRLYRDLDDSAQASVLRLITAMPPLSSSARGHGPPGRLSPIAATSDIPPAGRDFVGDIGDRPDVSAWVAVWDGLTDVERREQLAWARLWLGLDEAQRGDVIRRLDRSRVPNRARS
jgi:transcriptional regulator with XRE-family HTH domain